MTQIKPRLRLIIALVVPVVLAAVGFLGLHLATKPAKTVINQQESAPALESGTVSGTNQGDKGTLATAAELKYESPQTETKQPKTNTVGLQWEQQGDEAAVVPEVRIFDGSRWTDWSQMGASDDKKDGTSEATHSALVLTSNAHQVQYRFSLNGQGKTVSVSNPRLTFIDATQGPNPGQQSKLGKLFGGKANAALQGPRIFSRGEWGCPQATSSPAWGPEYTPLQRVMVHHTVTVGNPSDSGSEIRGIWQYHTYSNNWGDIGYNYLVDKNGNIYQGRYFDQQYADANKVEVIGGHTYGFNQYSIGIAALGNFEASGTTSGLNEGISNIAGYKMAPYGLRPWDTYPDSGGRTQYRINGHRNYTSTECPGNNLFARLGDIRNRATQFTDVYGVQRYWDYSYAGQGVNGAISNQVNLSNGQQASLYLDLKNEGENTWSNSGANPVRLGTDRPFNRGSSFSIGSGWLSGNRTGTFANRVTIAGNGTKTLTPASTIAKGEIARFTFTVTNPNLQGAFPEFFRPVVEGITFFPRDAGMWWQINAQADIFQAQWLHQNYAVPTIPNTTGTLRLTLKNTGNMAWTNTGDASTVKLGTTRPSDRVSPLQHSSWESATRVGSFVGKARTNPDGSLQFDGSHNVLYDAATTIAPGEVAQWVFTVQTPATSYNAQEFFNPVVDGRGWLNDLGIWWPTNVEAGYRAQFAGQSGPVTIDKSDNPVGSIFFDFKNTGGVAWVKTGTNPIRIGTDKPRDRGSGFATFGLSAVSSPALPTNAENWLSYNRVNSFSGKVTSGVLDPNASSIQPGETARFIIALDTRNIAPGQYPEWFSPVVENVGWLNYGTWLPITVQN